LNTLYKSSLGPGEGDALYAPTLFCKIEICVKDAHLYRLGPNFFLNPALLLLITEDECKNSFCLNVAAALLHYRMLMFCPCFSLRCAENSSEGLNKLPVL